MNLAEADADRVVADGACGVQPGQVPGERRKRWRYLHQHPKKPHGRAHVLQGDLVRRDHEAAGPLEYGHDLKNSSTAI